MPEFSIFGSSAFWGQIHGHGWMERLELGGEFDMPLGEFLGDDSRMRNQEGSERIWVGCFFCPTVNEEGEKN